MEANPTLSDSQLITLLKFNVRNIDGDIFSVRSTDDGLQITPAPVSDDGDEKLKSETPPPVHAIPIAFSAEPVEDVAIDFIVRPSAAEDQSVDPMPDVPAPDPDDYLNQAAVSNPALLEPLPLPTLPTSISELAELSAPLFRFVPNSCGKLFTNALSDLLRAVSFAPDECEHWIRLVIFTRVTLFKVRGGLAGRQRTKNSILVRKRLERWKKGDTLALWSEYVLHCERLKSKRSGGGGNVRSEGQIKRANRIRCLELARDRSYSKAVSALSSAGVLRMNDAVHQQLLDLHPSESPMSEGDLQKLSVDEDTAKRVAVKPDDMREYLRRCDKTAAGGLDQIRAAYLKDSVRFDSECDILKALCLFVNRMANTHLDGFAYDLFYGGRMIPLPKGEQSVRPIGVGSILRRLFALSVWEPNKPEITAACGRSQYGVGTKGGVEIVALRYTVDCERLKTEPSKVIIQLDWSNAFNRLARKLITRGVTRYAPSLKTYLKRCYSRAVPMVCTDGRIIPSMTGITQGDTLGPALYSIGQRMLFDEVGIPIDQLFCYLDDTYLIADLVEAERLLLAIQRSGAAYGMKLNMSKCRWVSRSPVPPTLQSLGISKDTPDDTSILNVPIGERMAGFLRKKFDEWMNIVNEVVSLGHAQTSLLLLRQCLFGYTRFNYWIRLTPSIVDPAIWKMVDKIMFEAVEVLLGRSLTEATRLQIQLPLRTGGIALRSTTLYSSASIITCFKGVICELRRRGDLTVDSGLREWARWIPIERADMAIDEFNTLTGSGFHTMNLDIVDSPLALTDDAVMLQLMAKADVRHKRLLRELSKPGCAAWLRAAPSHSEGLALDSQSVSVLLAFRLGIPILSRMSKCEAGQCDKVNDVYGDHSIECKWGRAWTFRHDSWAIVWRELLVRTGLQPETEQRVIGHERARPADLLIPGRVTTNGREVYLDFGVTHRGVTRGVTDSCELYYHKKRKEFRDRFADDPPPGDYIPMISTVVGHWESTTARMFGKWCSRLAHRANIPIAVCKDYWRVKLQLGLAKAVAKSMIYHLPTAGIQPGLRLTRANDTNVARSNTS